LAVFIPLCGWAAAGRFYHSVRLLALDFPDNRSAWPTCQAGAVPFLLPLMLQVGFGFDPWGAGYSFW